MKQDYIIKNQTKITNLLAEVDTKTKHDYFWNQQIAKSIANNSNVHLAVFVEPFLKWVIEGKKNIESRFSKNKCAPFEKINSGDVILLKKSGGPIIAIARAGIIWSYQIQPGSWKEIKDKFTHGLCAQDPSFWTIRASASYATLIRLENVISIDPIIFEKKDRRGWVVLTDNSELKLKSE